MESILTSIKKLLGIPEEHEHFDSDLIMDINSVFSILTQLGVGPPNGFSIENEDKVWTDFIPEVANLELVKSYVHLKTKMLFDPPNSSAALEAINRIISELEWRIAIIAEENTKKEEAKNV